MPPWIHVASTVVDRGYNLHEPCRGGRWSTKRRTVCDVQNVNADNTCSQVPTKTPYLVQDQNALLYAVAQDHNALARCTPLDTARPEDRGVSACP